MRTVRRLAGEWAPVRWAVRIAARTIAPRHYVGAVGVVFDEAGRVLILEHAFRTDFPWGLPGGWIERGEAPADAIRRELREELGVDVEVGELIACGVIGRVATSTHPLHLGLAYLCRIRFGTPASSAEILAAEWVDPYAVGRPLEPFQHQAILEAARRRDGRSAGQC